MGGSDLQTLSLAGQVPHLAMFPSPPPKHFGKPTTERAPDPKVEG
jgi:hypothetical protein